MGLHPNHVVAPGDGAEGRGPGGGGPAANRKHLLRGNTNRIVKKFSPLGFQPERQ